MIQGCTGLMGQGKTLFTTHMALRALKDGWQVFANYEIRGAECVDDMSDLFRASLPEFDETGQPIKDAAGRIAPKLIIIDEANLTCPSRYWNKLDPRVLYYWSQSRKLGLEIIWTAQHERRVDTALREITYRIWHSHHFGKLHWYTANLPDESDKKKRTGMGFHWLYRSMDLCRSYDTFRLINLSRDIITTDGPDYRTGSQAIDLKTTIEKKRRFGR